MSNDEKPRVPKIYQNQGMPPRSRDEVTTERGPGGAEVKVTTVNGQKIRFIDNYWTFALATAFLGPFALPLFLRNPRASREAKIIVTVIMVVLTALLFWVQIKFGKWAKSQYDQAVQMQQLMQQGVQ